MSYSVSRMGIDGSGSVSSVNEKSPSDSGNVTLTADDIQASGNASVQDELNNAVKYNTPQTLTPAQQAQARDNINAPAPYEAGDNISITGGIITTKAFPCNPRLLDNWYWGNPVNQRGQTSYAGAGYTIDRWKTYASGTIALSGGHLSLTEVTDFGQQIEISRMSVDCPVTFSVLTDTGLAWSTHKFAGDTNETWYENIGNGITLNMIYNWISSGTVLVGLQTQAANIRAVGLELGTQQTLAHKEYGEWVLNEIPKFGDQLAECQRYYYRAHYVQYQTINMAYEDTAYAFVMLPLPVAMRIDNPVLTQSKPIALGISEKIMTAAEAKGCMARLGVNYAAISNAQRPVYSYCADPEGVTFELSADL